MTDRLGYDDLADAEPGGIGVGMGGSCPVCRAPVDLGQEFCLECGSPIRFTPRQRRKSTSSGERATVAPPPTPVQRGFPWVPFLIVLALVVGGVAFAYFEGRSDSAKRTSKDSTAPALPEITSSTAETTSETQTTTLQDCDPASPIGGTQPTSIDSGDGSDPASGGFDLNDPLDSAGEQIPTISADSSLTDPAAASPEAEGDVPSTNSTPSDDSSGGSSGTVTVDQNGALCAADDGAGSGDETTPPLDPTDTSSTTDTDVTPTSTPSTPTDSTNASGAWPANEEGWTVVVASDRTQARANQRAADLQERNIDAGVLVSSDFSSLCPGFYVVFSGRFDTKAKAEAHASELKAKDTNLFGIQAREIRRSGSQVDCTVSRP